MVLFSTTEWVCEHLASALELRVHSSMLVGWDNFTDKLTDVFLVPGEFLFMIISTASSLMLKYECHGCTDVTGFGIKGHANNLARVQKKSLELRIHTLPVIRNATAIVEKSGKFQTLLQGTSAETSGGLLMMLKPDKAKQFIDELKQLEGRESWIIGEVISAEERKAVLVDGIKIQEVPSVEEENYLW